MTRRDLLATAAAVPAFAQSAPRCAMGFSPDCFAVLKPPRTPLDLLENAHRAGAGGVQVPLVSFEPAELKKIRARAEELGMYLEVTTALPGPDTAQFEKTLTAARELGAKSVRSVCLSGRRYETFDSLEKWRGFVAESKEKLARAARLVDEAKIPLGVENHKDWTVEDYLALLKVYGGEYLGVCIDFGNNLSLLDDPTEVVEALAPYVINTHIKDMAVEEYADGFLMSEVALGRGFLDLKRMVAAVKKARPDVKFSLDMLTRDPLKIPCLTEKYWLTFPERNGRYLASALRRLREHRSAQPLVRVTALERAEQLRVEMDNLTASVSYARDVLMLRA